MTAEGVLGGHVFLKFAMVQVVVAMVVLFILRQILERELFYGAMEQISGISLEAGVVVEEVVVLTARVMSQKNESSLNALCGQRFPLARVVYYQDTALHGGVVVHVGRYILDYSLSTKIKQLYKG
ncbi:MAG: F0F1 ATP synthase subunit delta [Candidatus Omnitrophota bacterium]